MAEATARRHFSKAAYFDKIKDYRVKHFYIPGQKKMPGKFPGIKNFTSKINTHSPAYL
jgi:hypothetical protein